MDGVRFLKMERINQKNKKHKEVKNILKKYNLNYHNLNYIK